MADRMPAAGLPGVERLEALALSGFRYPTNIRARIHRDPHGPPVSDRAIAKYFDHQSIGQAPVVPDNKARLSQAHNIGIEQLLHSVVRVDCVHQIISEKRKFGLAWNIRPPQWTGYLQLRPEKRPHLRSIELRRPLFHRGPAPSSTRQKGGEVCREEPARCAFQHAVASSGPNPGVQAAEQRQRQAGKYPGHPCPNGLVGWSEVAPVGHGRDAGTLAPREARR